MTEEIKRFIIDKYPVVTSLSNMQMLTESVMKEFNIDMKTALQYIKQATR